ncbi:hypothetical protein SAMN05421811_11269 [Nonomuraea wenchangensis]|uniref:Uncharacterized protein n=1 Tax=Nonomuraea wenchangensis TaxID=568860 RepID=A0A1I0L566_9ACTN|nr:hypothetical protein SAMN05421811_11269 [Nonomuraea wenchangensis]
MPLPAGDVEIGGMTPWRGVVRGRCRARLRRVGNHDLARFGLLGGMPGLSACGVSPAGSLCARAAGWPVRVGDRLDRVGSRCGRRLTLHGRCRSPAIECGDRLHSLRARRIEVGQAMLSGLSAGGEERHGRGVGLDGARVRGTEQPGRQRDPDRQQCGCRRGSRPSPRTPPAGASCGRADGTATASPAERRSAGRSRAACRTPPAPTIRTARPDGKGRSRTVFPPADPLAALSRRRRLSQSTLRSRSWTSSQRGVGSALL